MSGKDKMDRRDFLVLLPTTGLVLTSVRNARAAGLMAPTVGIAQDEPAGPEIVSPAMKELSAYMAAAGGKALPDDVAEKTKHHVIDTIAAMASGTTLPPGKMAISFVQREGGAGDASVIGTRLLTSAANAAFANGMLAHADETDDSHQPAYFHPGCAIVPASLVMAEREKASGNTMLRAVALGYDIGARFNFALGVKTFDAAGHSTHSFGALFGAAAAAGLVARLDAEKMRYLISYAAQQASGVSTWPRDREHIEKAFDFGGMPARNAVSAATMVAHGMTGVGDVLSGEHNFLFAFGAEASVARLTQKLGTTYEILSANIKKWSVGSPIQAALDSMLALIKAERITPDNVAHIKVEVQSDEMQIVNNRDMPDICMQHLVALMLVDGTVTFLSTHDKPRMTDPRVLKVREKVEYVGSDELMKAGGRQAIVTVTLGDGKVLRHHTKAVKGTADDPMTRAEVEEKSLDLLTPTLGKARAKQLVDTVWRLEGVQNVRTLRPLWQGEAGTSSA